MSKRLSLLRPGVLASCSARCAASSRRCTSAGWAASRSSWAIMTRVSKLTFTPNQEKLGLAHPHAVDRAIACGQLLPFRRRIQLRVDFPAQGFLCRIQCRDHLAVAQALTDQQHVHVTARASLAAGAGTEHESHADP